jgi:hypothetical protein
MNLISRHVVFSLIFCTVVLGSLVGCARPSTPSNEMQSGAAPPPSPKTITPADLVRLRWIEGTWRGTGATQPPFFERYHFENDTTLVMEELADQTATDATRTTRYELKDGKFGNERYVATALDDKSITFAPLIQGRNSFRWQSESKDVWKAILTLPATGSAPAKETIYVLERWPAK